jgi:hypothetical protein
MVLHVTLISTEDDSDLVVSFGLEPSAAESLTVMRSPQYEHLLADEDRGATIARSSDPSPEPLFLTSVNWVEDTLQIEAANRKYTLDLSKVDAVEIADAKRIVRLMNSDGRFKCNVA